MKNRLDSAQKSFEHWARDQDLCLDKSEDEARTYASDQTERAFLLRCKPDQKEIRNASAIKRANKFLESLGVVDISTCDVTALVLLMQTGRNADRYLLLRNNAGQGKLWGRLPSITAPFTGGQSYTPLGLDDACDACLKILRS